MLLLFLIATAFFVWLAPWIKLQVKISNIGNTELTMVSVVIAIFLFLIFDFFNG